MIMAGAVINILETWQPQKIISKPYSTAASKSELKNFVTQLELIVGIIGVSMSEPHIDEVYMAENYARVL